MCLLTEKCLLQQGEINWLTPALSCMSTSNFLITTTLHNMEIKNIIISSNYQKHTHFPTGWHYVMNSLVKRKKKDKTFHTCLRRQSDRFVMRVIIYIKKKSTIINFLNFWKGINFLPELIMNIFLLFIIFSYFLSWDSFITNYWTWEIKNRQHPFLK